MARKRKHLESGRTSVQGPAKRPRRSRRRQRGQGEGEGADAETAPGIDHPAISPYYHQVLSLRHYLLAKLPPSSRSRRRRLGHLGRTHRDGKTGQGREEARADHQLVDEPQLAAHLDSTVVGVSEPLTPLVNGARVDRALFSQPRSILTGVSSDSVGAGVCLQVEVRGASGVGGWGVPMAHETSRSSTMPSGCSSTGSIEPPCGRRTSCATVTNDA